MAQRLNCALVWAAVSSLCAAAAAESESVAIALRAAVGSRQVLPGSPTQVWSYEASLLSGPAGALASIPGSFVGPVIRVRTGDRLTVEFTNNLPEETTIHWHGLDVPAVMDGHPHHAVPAGGSRTITFPIINRAGTYWFHPHPHMRTGAQVTMGLAGMVIVSDPQEQALGLPDGEFDVPLVIQDRRFDAQNQFIYAMPMVGNLGDRILVNGKPDAVVSVATRAYRLRLLNGSTARAYKLAWSDGTPVTVIGTDGGLLAAPEQRPYVMLAPGERIELWLDLSNRPVGYQLTLRSLTFSGFGAGSPTIPQGAALDIMRFSVDRAEAETRTLPATLTPFDRYRIEDAANAADPRTFGLAFVGGAWTLNGQTYDNGVTMPNETVPAGTLEVWRFTNQASGMMAMAHPMHVHGPQFLVHSRTVAPTQAAAYATVSQGLVDSGWKDTVIVMPGEQVTFLVRTTHYPGNFLYHCHNLEHEDMGMMRDYFVVAACPADIAPNGAPNGAVDGADLSTMLAGWGYNPGSLADLDGDGIVGGTDLARLLAAWGVCSR